MFFKAKPVSVPKTLEHWYGDMAAVARLREILEDPTFQLACASLCAAAAPNATSVTNTADHNAARLNWLAGYNDAFRDLQKLTKIPTSYSDLPEEWAYIS